jgi:cation diffusion facilitator CzcD-associated flavoprotein CzcO
MDFLPTTLAGKITSTLALTTLTYKLNQTYQESKQSTKRMARLNNPNTPSCIIIGAGFSGICMSKKLTDLGIPHIIFEKERDVGGTWLLNEYPACQNDVPSHGYCFSFEMNPNWNNAFSPQPEILAYTQHVARKYHVYEHCRFHHEVREAKFDCSKNEWVLTVFDRQNHVEQVHRARFLISAIGGLHIPSYPKDIKGRGTLHGVEMHSAEWRKDVSLEGKNVIVVGSAASAVQIVPAIAPIVKQLTVVQRTPNWLAPQHSPVLPGNLTYSPWVRWLFNTFPIILLLHRWAVYWSMESVFIFGLFNDGPESFQARVGKWLLTKFMMRQLRHDKKGLADKVIPKYDVGCKRIIRSEKFLPALQRDNVELITDRLVEVVPEGVKFLVENNTTTTTRFVPADVIVWATGFEVGSMGPVKLFSADGKTCISGTILMDQAKRFPSHLGITTPDYPNSFVMLGLRTGLGHNSILIHTESQADYVCKIIDEMIEKGYARCSIKRDKAIDFSNTCDEALKNTVWVNGGCKSWYQSGDGTTAPALWPYSTLQYMWDASMVSLDDFDVSRGSASRKGNVSSSGEGSRL